ncbi:MAG: NlpC/P60 family protein [Alphaproteobacteria bacterium]
MNTLDIRLNAYRPDLADRRLEGSVKAESFCDGVPYQVAAASLPVRQQPRPTAPQDTVLLHGETVRVFDTGNGWAWIQNDADRYVGYVDLNGLTATIKPPTHRVATLRTLVFPDKSIKSPPLVNLSFGARVTVSESQTKLASVSLPDGRTGFIPAEHLAPVDSVESDPVAVALQFLNAPYLWGGKTADGLDCSALVQLGFSACGIPCPRDTDLQEAEFGYPVDFSGDEAVLERGDCVFWPGHVGLWMDEHRFLHATAAFMKCVIEPLSTAIPRISRDAGLEVSSVRRPGTGKA